MARVGDAGKLYELHPGDGQYDVLAIAPKGERPNVHLNRAGSIHVGEHPNTKVLMSFEGWQDLGSGESSTLASHPGRRWEPKRRRLRLFSIAGRLARSRPPDRPAPQSQQPWTSLFIDMMQTLRHLPAPAN